MQVPNKRQANKYKTIDIADTDMCNDDVLWHLLAVAWIYISSFLKHS